MTMHMLGKRMSGRWGLAVVAVLWAGLAQGAEEILIGGALSLTGVQAPLDEPGLKGAKVAVAALNEGGGLLGKPVRFVNLDGKSDPVTVGNIAVELIDQGAQLMVAPCDFDFGGPASREAQKAGIVGISTCASDPLYSSWSLGDKQFTLSMWNTTMGATAAEYALKERGWKSAYVVTDQFIAYTKSLSKYFVERYEAMYGSAPDTSFVATGWDTIMLMAEAVKRAGTTDGAAVAEALESNTFDLLTGKLSYSDAAAGHYPQKAAALVGLTQGKPAFLGWRQPKDPPAP